MKLTTKRKQEMINKIPHIVLTNGTELDPKERNVDLGVSTGYQFF